MRTSGGRVVHVAYTDTQGGAARGMYGLHRGLRERGVDSVVAVARKFSADPDVYQLPAAADVAARVGVRVDRVWGTARSGEMSSGFRPSLVPTAMPRLVRRLRPDVVNLHWIAQGTLSVPQIASLPKPLVWTVRDMWAITGGCNYDEGCGRFVHGCGDCPLLGRPHARDLSRSLNEARQALRREDITFVALSGWMRREIERSHAWRGARVVTIPPGIDVATFSPQPAAPVRQRLGVAPGERLVGFFSAAGADDGRKGYRQAVAALRRLRAAGEDVTLLVVGGRSTSMPDPGIRVVDGGRVADDGVLAQLYSACDLVLVPSLQEAFGKVAVEAMACGTPVVCFAGTGVADAVTDGVTGFVAECGSDVSLAARITDAFTRADLRAMGAAAVDAARERFSSAVQAEAYAGLYEELLSHRPQPAVAGRGRG